MKMLIKMHTALIFSFGRMTDKISPHFILKLQTYAFWIVRIQSSKIKMLIKVHNMLIFSFGRMTDKSVHILYLSCNHWHFGLSVSKAFHL